MAVPYDTPSKTMLCVTAPTYTDPSKYEHSHLPAPALSEPTDVRIDVHAASINPIDVKKASGVLKIAIAEQYVWSNPFLPALRLWNCTSTDD